MNVPDRPSFVRKSGHGFGHGFGHGSVTVLATIAGLPQSSLILMD
jgi:hypothetical protein